MSESKKDELCWSFFDTRSLALFRIGLGIVLFLNIAGRIPWIREFYTDQGVLPRDVLSQSAFANEWLDLHSISGSWGGEFALLGLQLLLALGLLLGWRTRFMLVASWFMFNSLMARNPFVNDRGDLELELLLFWGFFLPLGGKWSLDARAGRAPGGSSRGLAPAALILQLAQVYFYGAFLKIGFAGSWFVRGDGFFWSLQSPLFATPLSGYLAQAPMWFHVLINYLVLAGEVFWAFLLLVPLRVTLCRSLAAIEILLFHLGVLFLFKLGLFPFIAIVPLAALIPPRFWLSRLGVSLQSKLDSLAGAEEPAELGLSLATKCFLGFSMLLCLLSNASYRTDYGALLVRPKPIEKITSALRIEQFWELFGPITPYIGYFEFVDKQGNRFYSTPKSRWNQDGKPFLSHRWRMLMISSFYSNFDVVRPGLVRFFAAREGRDWRDTHYFFRVRRISRQGALLPEEAWRLY